MPETMTESRTAIVEMDIQDRPRGRIYVPKDERPEWLTPDGDYMATVAHRDDPTKLLPTLMLSFDGSYRAHAKYWLNGRLGKQDTLMVEISEASTT